MKAVERVGSREEDPRTNEEVARDGKRLFRVFGSQTTYWAALVKAKNSEEAVAKAERYEWEEIEDEHVIGDFRVGDVEEVDE